MSSTINCHCGGRPECRLCQGANRYRYEPGPRGWMPFPCPTCEGAGHADGHPEPCPTCRGAGRVDPADPPVRGWVDVVCKSLFGV